jgi:hypothetical protein
MRCCGATAVAAWAATPKEIATAPVERKNPVQGAPAASETKSRRKSNGHENSAAVARGSISRRASMPTRPPPNRIAIGFKLRKNVASDRPPSAANLTSFNAVPSRQIAIAITLITAALIPASADAVWGSAPNLT